MQHAAVAPASVAIFFVPMHRVCFDTCMLSCRTLGIICDEKAGASSIYTCLSGYAWHLLRVAA